MSSKKQLASTFPNMLGVLVVVCILASLIMALVFNMTEPTRLEVEKKRTQKALEQVLPQGFTQIDAVRPGKDGAELYMARDAQGKWVGTAVTATSEKAFADPIRIMAGFGPDGQVVNVVVLAQKETPGLGTKMTEEGFRSQFKKLQAPYQVDKDGGDVVAISAATISSRAFCDAMNRAAAAFQEGGRE